MADYSQMTNEEFENILETICNEYTGEQLLRIPGVYEILSEHFNNAVLERWEEQHEEEEDDDAT